MIIEAAAGAFLVGQFIYHRWFEDKPLVPRPPGEIQIPITSEGSPVPILVGRDRIRTPVLVWAGKPIYDDPSYSMNMFFWLAIPFKGGRGTNRIHNMWEGDKKFIWFENPLAAPGTGGFLVHTATSTVLDGGPTHGISVEFLSGGPTQKLVDDDGAAVTNAGQRMMDSAIGNLPANRIPGYRGYMSVHLLNLAEGQQWIVGSSASVNSYSFEGSTYYDLGDYPAPGVLAQIGPDANPANAIYDLMTGGDFGKLGLSTSLIDFASFQAAGSTLAQESFGCSRVFNTAAPAEEHLNELLRHVDGTLDVNPDTGKWRLKLIRPDFNPSDIFHITKDNCQKLVGVAIGSSSDIVNKVAVTYEDRARDYTDAVERDWNQANAVAQSQTDELLLEFRCAKSAAQAKAIAVRERAARSSPIFKFRAILNREGRNLMRGDPVKVTYKGIAGMIFRVADVDRGTRTDRAVAVDLISDSFYTWRNQTPQTFPGSLVPPGDIQVMI